MSPATKKPLKYKIPLLAGAVLLCTAGFGFQAATAAPPLDASTTQTPASCPRLEEDPNWVPQGSGLQDGTGPHGQGGGLKDGSGHANGSGRHGSGLHDGSGPHGSGSGVQDGTGPHGAGNAAGNGSLSCQRN